MKAIKISILGAEYEISQAAEEKDAELKTCRGYCKFDDKKIVIDKDYDKTRKSHTVRHEIIHAFLHESGLKQYSYDETLVDWIAMQCPKMLQAFKAAKCL